MIKSKGFVVLKDGLFYRNNGNFTEELQKAKDYNSYSTAKKVAKKIGGNVRELYYST